MRPEETQSFTELTTNKDIEQIDAAIEFMLLEIADLNFPRDLISRRLFEYGFELAQAENRADAAQATTWMTIIDGVHERASRLRCEFDQAFATTAPN